MIILFKEPKNQLKMRLEAIILKKKKKITLQNQSKVRIETFHQAQFLLPHLFLLHLLLITKNRLLNIRKSPKRLNLKLERIKRKEK